VHVLLALDSSVEGEASAHYLKNFFQKYGVAVHRLAFGIPMNASLEYIDANTLAKAIERGVPF
jgi:recombination protein RecR